MVSVRQAWPHSVAIFARPYTSMGAYVLRRLGQMVPVLNIVSRLTFGLIIVLPAIR